MNRNPYPLQTKILIQIKLNVKKKDIEEHIIEIYLLGEMLEDDSRIIETPTSD
jgi:hypothetical protein